MGFVFEAWQLSLQRVVALKVLAGMANLTPTAVQRFQREAQAAAKLHHTNIVPIYAQGEHDGVYYYAMELIRGRSVYEIVEEARRGDSAALGVTETRPGGFTPAVGDEAAAGSSLGTTTWSRIRSRDTAEHFDTIARLTATVAEALEYAHQAGVIHRDVKPHNLILGNDGRLCITDFGLARVMEQPGVTMTGEFLGSPLYMSPEQISGGPQRVDRRTDIYSLGATLYEWLTLRPPFPGETREQVISLVMTADPDTLRSRDPHMPVDLETICLKAIQKNPAARYQTAAEMASDLRRYLERRTIHARRAGPLTRATKFVIRHRVEVLAAALVLVTLGLGSAWWRESRRADTATAPRTVQSDQQSQAVVEGADGGERVAVEPTPPPTPSGADALVSSGSQGPQNVPAGQPSVPVDVPPGMSPSAVAAAQAQEMLAAFFESSQSSLAEQLDRFAPEVSRRLADDLAASQLQVLRSFVEGTGLDASEVAQDSAEGLYFQAMATEEPEAALSLLDQALAKEPDHYQARSLRTILLCRLSRFADMAAEGERLVAARPESAGGYLLAGAGRLLMGDSDAALAALDKARELGGESPSVHALRGLAYARSGDLITAMQAYNAALALAPGHVIARLARGKAHFYMGTYDAALTDAQKLVELLPDNVEPYIFRAECYEKLQQFSLAVADYYKVIELGGSSPSLWAKLGWAAAIAREEEIRSRAEAEPTEPQAPEQPGPADEPDATQGTSQENMDVFLEWLQEHFRGGQPTSAGEPTAATGGSVGYPFP